MTLRNLRGDAPETWHERFMRLGAAKDYAGCLAMLRAPASTARLPDSPSVPQDEPNPLLKLVPVEPTEEMQRAYALNANPMGLQLSKAGYRAMLNAVPTIPGGGGSSRTNLECDGERAATERRRDLDAELNRRLSNALENYARDNNLTMGEVAEAARSLLITPATEGQRKSEGKGS